jgi:hypothetical protein
MLNLWAENTSYIFKKTAVIQPFGTSQYKLSPNPAPRQGQIGVRFTTEIISLPAFPSVFSQY